MISSRMRHIQSLQTPPLIIIDFNLLSILIMFSVVSSISSFTLSNILFWELTSVLKFWFSIMILPTTWSILSRASSCPLSKSFCYCKSCLFSRPLVLSYSPSSSLVITFLLLYSMSFYWLKLLLFISGWELESIDLPVSYFTNPNSTYISY